MAIILKDNFPVAEALTGRRDSASEIWRKIAIVNIMPNKQRTEADFIRIFDSFDETTAVEFVSMASHKAKSADTQKHLDQFYTPLSEVNLYDFDGLIVTGAPVELIDFEDVDYWNEFIRLVDEAERKVPSALFICWAAFGALYHRYGIRKEILNHKLSGAYEQNHNGEKIFEGIPQSFRVPHSRNTRLVPSDVDSCSEISIIAHNENTGPHIIKDKNCSYFYQLGHWEYNPDTLDMEYRRDSGKGLNPKIPENYYRENNPDKGYEAGWEYPGRKFFHNWLSHFATRK